MSEAAAAVIKWPVKDNVCSFLLLSTDVMSSSSESQERCPKPDG